MEYPEHPGSRLREPRARRLTPTLSGLFKSSKKIESCRRKGPHRQTDLPPHAGDGPRTKIHPGEGSDEGVHSGEARDVHTADSPDKGGPGGFWLRAGDIFRGVEEGGVFRDNAAVLGRAFCEALERECTENNWGGLCSGV